MVKMEAQMETLKVTQVEVAIINSNKQKIKADVKVVLNEQLQLTGLKIRDGKDGFYVTYPSDMKVAESESICFFYPLTKELREHIELCALEKYQELRDA